MTLCTFNYLQNSRRNQYQIILDDISVRFLNFKLLVPHLMIWGASLLFYFWNFLQDTPTNLRVKDHGKTPWFPKMFPRKAILWNQASIAHTVLKAFEITASAPRLSQHLRAKAKTHGVSALCQSLGIHCHGNYHWYRVFHVTEWTWQTHLHLQISQPCFRRLELRLQILWHIFAITFASPTKLMGAIILHPLNW